MKNATKHADELKSLLKRLLREERPPEKPVLDPLHALVRGAMSFDVPDGKAEDRGGQGGGEDKQRDGQVAVV